MKRRGLLMWGMAAAASALLPASDARACGCFAQPSVATPVVQAGEQILFAHDGNQVIAYIKIQYSGSADQFGWLVPLPSVPKLQLGTDELFTLLAAQTQPSYLQTTTRNFCGGGSSTVGCGAFGSSGAQARSGMDGGFGMFAASDLGANNHDVVVQSSIGPYDYAVLRADDQTEMLSWLQSNKYFVPDATGKAVAPYIHPGGYFLALKLRSGQSTGDIVPIVLRYASDLPMIPITLTQVGAVPDMGILVWVLGEHRAVPRNYHHVVLDELPIWANSQSYAQLVKEAIHSAPKRHAFITEYAGTSGVMFGKLYYAGRFGDLAVLRTINDRAHYLRYLGNHGFTFDSTLFAVLERYIPEPAALAAQGVTEGQYYGNYYLYDQSGSADAGPQPTFDPAALTDELDMRIVQPTKATDALFGLHPYLTRLLTVMSPEDMNADPVFSENPDLADVRLVHTSQITIPCKGSQWISTDQGFVSAFPIVAAASFPPALRLEALRDAGPPHVEVDNTPLIEQQLGKVDTTDPSAGGSRGCHVVRRSPDSTVLLVIAALALGARMARRRRRA